MSRRSVVRLFTALLAALLPLTVASTATAGSAAADPGVQAYTVYYDASGAQEFVDVVHQAAQLWNNTVSNVQLVPGSPSDVQVYADNGWPRTYSAYPGTGYWIMGRQAVDMGYYTLRIATHEFGHILGLPDDRTGLCSDLMSGSSAPVSCQNANPSPAEAAEVEAIFSRTVPASTTQKIYIDAA